MTENEHKVLAYLCRHNVSILDGWHPVPSTLIADIEHLTLYKTRKALKSLKEMGYVESIKEGGQTEDGIVYCYHGYCVTKKAVRTDEYKEAWEDERALVKECFGFDMGEVEKDLEYWR